MSEEKITVVMVEPREHPKVVTLDNDLDALQKAVSIGSDDQGLIEVIRMERGIDIICNEEGKLNGLEGNRHVGMNIIAGVFYVVGVDDEGEFTSLSEEAQERYILRFWEPERITDEEIAKTIIMRFMVL